ncbi:DUF1573 domain-containing protein [Geofilum sp. OHC36d9]|uniref:DUF1573 domain-containing protein n=1 Tax=Geofilum sp. OHC36d9 TaxID=3458413 RepID=UPI004034CCE8
MRVRLKKLKPNFSFRIGSRLGVIFLFLSVSACNFSGSVKQEHKPSGNTVMTFDKTVHDFGTVSDDEDLGCRFTFVNSGSDILVISDVVAGCGCTAVEYSKKPLEPGQKGFLEVVFDPRGQAGFQRKNVRVFANIPDGSILIAIKANVN